jgi:hypothetical protein
LPSRDARYLRESIWERSHSGLPAPRSQRVPNVGAEVTGIDVGDYADTMQVLAYLEGMATSLTAPHLSTASLDEATALNEQMRALDGTDFDPVRFTELNERFHRLLCAACPNRHLLDLLDREWHRMSLVRRSSFIFLPNRPAPRSPNTNRSSTSSGVEPRRTTSSTPPEGTPRGR